MTVAIGLVVLLAFSAACGTDSSDTDVQRESQAVEDFVAEVDRDAFVSPRAALAFAQDVCFESREVRAATDGGRAVEPFCADGWLLLAPLSMAPREWP